MWSLTGIIHPVTRNLKYHFVILSISTPLRTRFLASNSPAVAKNGKIKGDRKTPLRFSDG
jgi:hypothetical protein